MPAPVFDEPTIEIIQTGRDRYKALVTWGQEINGKFTNPAFTTSGWGSRQDAAAAGASLYERVTRDTLMEIVS
tara:strand:- start:40969 stop:41187 length:219 start_codon:yes stop_codon:yes gene_type:complete